MAVASLDTPAGRNAVEDQRVARGLALTFATAFVTLGCALVAAAWTGTPLRDPRGVTLNRLATAIGIVLALAVLDALVAASRATGRRLPPAAAIRAALRARWTRGRLLAAGGGLLAFHVTYLGYRNLKSVAPLVRPGDLFDAPLQATDRALLFGHRPGVVLHDLLGTGVAAEALSVIYMAFFAFIPLTLAGALVFARRPGTGLFYAAALGLTWLLGAVSYFLLPSLGPVYHDPAAFAGLPDTAVSALQHRLLVERTAFLAHPDTAGTAQSIGAFASLHMAVYFTAAFSAHLCRLPRPALVVAWVLTALTFLSTLYFGWHYIVDAVGGLAIAAAAVAIAAAATGIRPRRRSA